MAPPSPGGCLGLRTLNHFHAGRPSVFLTAPRAREGKGRWQLRLVGTPPREWAERLYNVRRWTPMPKGGHFAPAEEPELLARDIAAFFAGL